MTSEGAASLITSAALPNASPQSWLTGLWVGVALCLLTAALWNLRRYLRVRATAHAVDAAVQEQFLRCKQELGVNCRVRLLQTSQLRSPAIFGWWSPTLLLPLGLPDQLTATELRHVFLHELAHVQRHDIVVNWLVALVQIVHWFNPLVWYGFRAMRADMEQACDGRVMSHLSAPERTEYGNTLIRLSDFDPEQARAQGAGIVESHSQLKARITMIAQFNPKRIGLSLFAGVLLTAITSAAVTQPHSTSHSEATSTIDEKHALDPRSIQASDVRPAASPASAKVATSPAVKLAASVPLKPTQVQIPGKNAVTGEPLRAEYLRITHIAATELVTLIKSEGLSLLSARGSVAADARTNTLLVHDTDASLKAIRDLVKTLDVPLDRVVIEARIVLVSDDFRRDLQARLASKIPSSADRGDAPNVNIQSPSRFSPIMALPADYDINAELATGEAEDRLEIVASPRLVVGDRKEAVIEQGIEFPSRHGGKGTASFQRMTLTLKLTPRITADKRILLDVGIARDSTEQTSAAPSARPSIDSREIWTQLVMNAGQSIALSNMFEIEQLGSGDAASTAPAGGRQRLLIFLTSRIVQDAVAKLD